MRLPELTFLLQVSRVNPFFPLIFVLGPLLIAKLYRDHEGFTAAKNSERHFVADLCAFDNAQNLTRSVHGDIVNREDNVSRMDPRPAGRLIRQYRTDQYAPYRRYS